MQTLMYLYLFTSILFAIKLEKFCFYIINFLRLFKKKRLNKGDYNIGNFTTSIMYASMRMNHEIFLSRFSIFCYASVQFKLFSVFMNKSKLKGWESEWRSGNESGLHAVTERSNKIEICRYLWRDGFRVN